MDAARAADRSRPAESFKFRRLKTPPSMSRRSPALTVIGSQLDSVSSGHVKGKVVR
jgi:hypothetical protein